MTTSTPLELIAQRDKEGLIKIWNLDEQDVEDIYGDLAVCSDEGKLDMMKRTADRVVRHGMSKLTKLPNKELIFARTNESLKILLKDPNVRKSVDLFTKEARELDGDNMAILKIAEKYLGFLPLSITAMDMSNLKKINDNAGHDVGDNTLRITADTLRDQIKAHQLDFSCSPAHLSGDEFMILGAANVDQIPRLDDVMSVVNNRMRDINDTLSQTPLGLTDEILKKTKAMISERMELKLGVDYGTVHISEGFAALNAICNDQGLLSEYCSIIDVRDSQSKLHELVKKLVNISYQIADKRSIYVKHLHKVRNFIEEYSKKKNHSELMAYADRYGLTPEKLESEIMSINEIKDLTKREIAIHDFAETIAKAERQKKEDAEARVQDILDEIAFRGVRK